jgi:cytochrome c-type biogenesis protein
MVIFLAYGLGMSIVLLSVTIVMALGKQSLVSKLRSSARHINRISGSILVVAGTFIVWFWTTEIASGASALGSSGVFQFVENLSQTALNMVADYAELVGGGFAALLAAAGYVVWRGRTPPVGEEPFRGLDRAGGDVGVAQVPARDA